VRLRDGMPRARLVSAGQRRRQADVVASTFPVALVESPVQGLAGSSAEPGTQGSIRIAKTVPAPSFETAAASRQLLVLTERFHRGWRVAEDGGERETIRVYGDYLGCLVDPGPHRVAFTFVPASTRDGFRASLAGVALTLVATLVLGAPRVRRRELEHRDARI
jgi:hypothetical protein